MKQSLKKETVLQLFQQKFPVLGVKGKGLPGISEGLRISTRNCLGKLTENAQVILWPRFWIYIHLNELLT